MKIFRLAFIRREAGFTYVGLLIAIAIFGLGSVGVARVLASSERAEKEHELLFVGAQFRYAIGSYYTASPGGMRYPQSLEDLLRDPRFPVVRRHLRRIYPDPITGRKEWGLIKAPGGGIMGIYSLSEREPMKRTGFESPNHLLNSASDSSGSTGYSYRNWQFVYLPPRTPTPS